MDDTEVQDITGVFVPEEKVKYTRKLVEQYGLEELPPETKQKAMQLIIQEVDDMFDMSDFKYDVVMKVGTDGLKDIKINQINMLMQQSSNLVQAGVVPGKILGLLMADMASAMDRPDIAKMIEEYEPQPDPMQQEMAKAELEGKKASNAKDAALAENALARSRSVDNEIARVNENKPLDQAKKKADVEKTYGDMSNAEMNTAATIAKVVNDGVDNEKTNA